MKKRIDWVFWIGIILLVLLLFKNPFSGQNIISDLEPSPDTIHYLSPAKSILNGQGLKITYKGRQLSSVVPPLYSLVIAPFIGLFNDIRAFYFVNLILVLISTILFYQIIYQLIKNKLIRFVIFISFITSTIIYWYPQVAMAENLLITLFLFSILLLLKPLTTRRLILSGFLVAAFYGTKYTALSLSGIFLVINLIVILKTKIIRQKKLLMIVLMLATSLIVFFIINWIEYLNKGFSILSDTIGHFKGLFSAINPSVQPVTGDFSQVYFKGNIITYLFGLIGGEIPVAGKYLTLIPTLIGFIGLVGLVLNPVMQKTKTYFYLFLASLSILFLISYFITSDARYIFVIIPSLILSAGIFLDKIVVFLDQKKRNIYSLLIILILFLSVLLQIFNPIKNQLTINFVTGEHPLNFETTQVFNNYFATHTFSQKPAVISTLPPYLIDFYSNQKYEVLPLSAMQYFSSTPLESWGIEKGVKFSDIYQQKLAENTPLFISDYRTKGYFYNNDFEQIKKQFKLTWVKTGCEGECNLYQLTRY